MSRWSCQVCLQTEDYARAMLSLRPDRDEGDLDAQVAVRMARQAVLERAQLWCVLDEGVLHRDSDSGASCCYAHRG